MREAACLDLMDQYQVGRPPAKLHQGCLSHTKLRLAVSSFVFCSCQSMVVLVCFLFSGFNMHVCVWWFQRPYVCSAGNCQACYRRKDHLTCHLLQHQGKVFKCPVESCNTEFSLQSNMKGRVEETHEDSSTSTSDKSYKQHACPETGCGKVFRFALQLWKHEDSHMISFVEEDFWKSWWRVQVKAEGRKEENMSHCWNVN